MIKYIFIAIGVLISAAAAQNAALYPDISVLSSDANGITLEYKPRFGSDKKIMANGSEYSLPRFQFETPSPLNQPGAEDIRTRVIPIALPSYSGNTVTVIASDYETMPSYALAPVPAVRLLDETGSVERTYRAEYRSQARLYPAAIAEFGPIGSLKGIVAGQLIISPYQYRSSTRELKKYSRIVVRIDYGTPDIAIDGSGNEQWATSVLLNHSMTKLWQSSRRFAKTSAASSVLSTGTWIKVEVTEDGIYKIDAAYLRAAGIDPVSRPISEVKVFGGEGRSLPENINTTRPSDLQQIGADYVDNNGNGTFDTDDYLLFYGQGVTGWSYDPTQKQFAHYGNPYTFSNFYFLCIGSAAPIKSMQTVSVQGTTNGSLRSVLGKQFFDEDKYNFNQSGQVWVSSPINAGESRTVSTKLPGYIPGTSITYRYEVFGRSPEGTSMSVDESGQTLNSVSFSGFDFSWYSYYAWPGTMQSTITTNLSDQRSMVKFKYNSTSNISTGYIGWLRIFYRQQLTASGNQLAFAAPDTSGVVSFDVDGFTRNDITMVEVSNFSSARKIQYQLQQQTGSVLFKDTMSAGSVRRYYGCTPDQFKTPKSFVKVPNSNLHAFNGAEFIIITHSEFKSEAHRLKQHKESLPGKKKITTAVIDVDTIFSEFGLGMPDPTALRDFIRYTTTQWTVKPKYVLFFGDASYDYRGILKNDRSWVPSYQTPESNVKISSYANEDYFSYTNPSSETNVEVAHGRLTPRTSSDAKTIVDKIIRYETGMSQGPWRNVITLVADDMWTPYTESESIHIWDAEYLASISIGRGFDVKRIYLEEYPVVYASTGRRKPTAREAILDQVNKGTVLLNYVGHGNPKVWAHENVLSQDDVRNQFVNTEKLNFIVAATCDWGRFDEAGESSSAEDAVLSKKGGSIGVLSANRAVYANENAVTNQKFYEFLFAGTPTLRLGDAYLLMKNAMSSPGYLENKQKYLLLGDPTVFLAAPEGNVTIDSLVTGSGILADSLRALDRITIKGSIRDTANAVMTVFNGTATVTVNDAEYVKSVTPVLGFSYNENGAVIYSGQATVTNGKINATFIVPKDISYTNKKGRVSVYFSGIGFDGRGFDKNFVVGGTNTSAPGDSIGPEITIYFDEPKFRSGDVVNEHPVLYVSLKDSSGINSSTHGIGHRLEAWIDGSTKSVDLTGYYQGTIDSYKEGTAAYALEDISPGNHSIAVRAWDVYNNSSTAETFFVVASSASLSIQQLFNFPNPVSTTTAFTFQHNQTVPIDVTLHIYTVSGRLIHTIERPAVPDRFVKIDWNRRDVDGDEIGNGVYFYKVIAKTIDGRYASEAIGKMAIVR